MTCHQTRQPEFELLDPHGERRGSVPTGCPPSTCCGTPVPCHPTDKQKSKPFDSKINKLKVNVGYTVSSRFKASLDYMELCLKKLNQTTKQTNHPGAWGAVRPCLAGVRVWIPDTAPTPNSNKKPV